MEEDPKKHTRHSEGVRLQEIPCGREGPKCLESMAAYVEIRPFTQYYLRLSSLAGLCSRQQGYKSVNKITNYLEDTLNNLLFCVPGCNFTSPQTSSKILL